MTNYKIYPATAHDIESFFGYKPKLRTRAIIASIDGDLVAIAGLHYMSQAVVAFSDMKDSMRPHKKFILKTAMALVDMIRHERRTVVALAEFESSHALLLRLGFEHVTDEVYKWPNF